MKKNYLPILLLVGAGIAAFMLLRKKEDENLPADEDQEPTVTKPETSAAAQAITKGLTKGLEKIKEALKAKKRPAAANIIQDAIKARKIAIERAKKAGVPKKAGAAVVKALSQGIRIKGFDDNNVLV
jgi:hypothetical protein